MVELVVLLLVVIGSMCIIGWTVHSLKPVKNKDWETKKREMARLFDGASSHIDIVTDLATEFFADPRIIESLRNAAERGVRIRIVCDPNGYKLNELEGLKNLVKSGLVNVAEAKQAFTEANDRHVMEVDGTWARLETYHPAKQMVEGAAQARIYRSPVIARFVEEKFNRRWEQSMVHSGTGVGD